MIIKKEPRLQSLDIFRGFTIAAMILVNTPGNWEHIYPALEHSKWNGCTPTDIVFPSFLFMVGISIVYAIQKNRENKALHGKILIGAFRRMVLLIVIGMSFQLINQFDLQNLRYPGVLQRIGLVYFISTLLFLKFSSKALSYAITISLISYYLIMTVIPVPDGHPANLDPSTNLAAYIDRLVFSVKHLYKPAKTWDPVGLLSTIPAIATTLLGIKVGLLLKRTDIEPVNKANSLFVAGIILILSGLAADLFFPINKALWSSSYVLYTAGICTLGLTLTYWFTDIKNRGKNLWFFFVFGTNAIAAYILSQVIPELVSLIKIHTGTHVISARDLLYNQFLLYLSPNNASVLSALCFVLFVWGILYPFYRKNIILKL